MSDIIAVPVAERLGVINNVEKKHAPEILYYPADAGPFKNCARIAIVDSQQPNADGTRKSR